MNDFKSGECRVMIATDIAAARGRHRPAAAGDQLRTAGGGRNLRPPHRPHGPRGDTRARRGRSARRTSSSISATYQKLTGLTIPTEGPVPEYAPLRSRPRRGNPRRRPHSVPPAPRSRNRPGTPEPNPHSVPPGMRTPDSSLRSGRPATRSRRPPAMPRRRRSLRKIRRSPRPGAISSARRARVADGARVPHRERPSSRPEKPPPALPTRRGQAPKQGSGNAAKAAGNKSAATAAPKTPPNPAPAPSAKPSRRRKRGRVGGTPPGPQRLPPPSPPAATAEAPQKKNGGKRWL